MVAKMKCSNCGAEISNLNLSWGRKYWMVWLFTLPLILVGFYPLARMTFFKGNPAKELVISDAEKRTSGNSKELEVLGLLTNTGGHQWSSVTLKAEFFDPTGKFIDEQSQYLQTTFAPGAKDHFKITISRPDPRGQNADTKMELKVAGAMSLPF